MPTTLALAPGNSGSLQLVALDAYTARPVLDYRPQNSRAWTPFGSLPGARSGRFSTLASGTGNGGNLQVVVLDTAGQPQLFWQDNSSGVWRFMPMPTTTQVYAPGFSEVAFVASRSGLTLVLLAADTKQPYTYFQDGNGSWFGPQPLATAQPVYAAGFCALAAGVGNANNAQILLLSADTRQLYLYWQDAATGVWSGPTALGRAPFPQGFRSLGVGHRGANLMAVMIAERDGQPYCFMLHASGAWEGASCLVDYPRYEAGFATLAAVSGLGGTLIVVLLTSDTGQPYVLTVPGGQPAVPLPLPQPIAPCSEAAATFLPVGGGSVEVVLREAGANCLWTASLGSGGVWQSAGRIAAPAWMQEIGSDIADMPLNRVILPGTHDSATYGITNDSPISPDAATIMAILKTAAGPLGVNGIMAGWAKAQSLSIAQQLRAGIRYFDLRVGLNGGAFWTMHSLFSVALVSSVLEPVRDFLADYPQEIVILDFNQFGGMGPEDFTALQSLIENSLGGYAPKPQALDPTSPVSLFLQRGARAILIWRPSGSDPKNGNPFFWDKELVSNWPNKQNPADLLSDLERNLGSAPANDFSVLQGVVTPDNTTVLNALTPGSTTPSNLLEVARIVSPLVLTWLPDWMRSLNIVILDHIETVPDYVPLIVGLNRAKARAAAADALPPVTEPPAPTVA